jgi:hypothetical protein
VGLRGTLAVGGAICGDRQVDQQDACQRHTHEQDAGARQTAEPAGGGRWDLGLCLNLSLIHDDQLLTAANGLSAAALIDPAMAC